MRRHWRRGYASESARELIRYGFDDLGLNRIFAQTMVANTAARATMSAAGLSHVRAIRGSATGLPTLPAAAVTACANRASGASCARRSGPAPLQRAQTSHIGTAAIRSESGSRPSKTAVTRSTRR